HPTGAQSFEQFVVAKVALPRIGKVQLQRFGRQERKVASEGDRTWAGAADRRECQLGEVRQVGCTVVAGTLAHRVVASSSTHSRSSCASSLPVCSLSRRTSSRNRCRSRCSALSPPDGR